MLNDSSHDARLRESKCRSHKRRARFWLFPLIVTSALFYSLILVIPIPATILLWWMVIITWRIRSRHLLLAEGYAKPFAEEIVAKARSNGRKFALFLRGFNLEAQSFRMPSGINIEFGFGDSKLYARPVEALLVEMLSEDLPLVALTNPNDPRPIGGAYRFKSIPSDWKQFVSDLLPDAFPIIMHLNTSYSLGVLDELELLKHPDYSKKAVIVAGKNVAVEDGDDGKWFKRVLAQFDYVVFQQTASGWSQKSEINFHHRLQECFRTIEHDSQEKQRIIRRDQEHFTLVTLPWWNKLVNFIRGPALGSVGSIIGIYYFIVPPFLSSSRYNPSVLIGKLLLMWIILVILLSILKGLLVILNYYLLK